MSYVKGTKAGKNEKPVKKSSYCLYIQLSISRRIKKPSSSKLEEEKPCSPILNTNPNSPRESPTASTATTSKKSKSEKEELSEKPKSDLTLLFKHFYFFHSVYLTII